MNLRVRLKQILLLKCLVDKPRVSFFSSGNGESSPLGETVDEGGEANGDSIVTVIEKSPEPPVSRSGH